MALDRGTRIGPYEVLEQIGSGGMGEVYRATDTNLKRDVAIKVLPASFAEDADRLARFQREAEVLASLNHTNIAQVYGLERSGERAVIVMELVEGPTLADRIAEGPLPPEEALSIARQVAAALEAAHGARVVHRDLKPANIKLRPDGTIKVLDFGIAKSVDTQAISGGRSPVSTTPAMTETGVILGTAAYMSPEQARGRFVDQRTDIWAFGCLMFEMLTGQPAFAGEDVMLTLARVLDRDTDLNSIPATVSPAVRHTIRLCLEKDPGKRIADIRDVRLALEGTFETELGSSATAAHEVDRRMSWWGMGATAVVAAAFAVAVTLVVSHGRTAPDPAEVRRFVHALPEGQRVDGPALPRLAVSPDGTGFVYTADGALYQRRFDELDARIVPGTEGESPVTPVFSPDGQWVLFESGRDGALKRVQITGGAPLPLMPDVPNSGWRWPRDDTILIGDTPSCRIYQMSPAGGNAAVIAEDPGFQCYEPTLLPGDKYLLYERRAAGNIEIAVMSLDSGESVALFPGKQAHYLEPGYLVYFDITLGLIGRTFDPDTLEYGNPVVLSDDIFMASPGGGVQFAVSSDGTLVFLQGDRAAEQGVLLAVADEDGQVALTNAPPLSYSYPSVSPTGAAVAVQAAQFGSVGEPQIYIYDLDGETELRQLTFDGSNFHPTWSADGGWITYDSRRDGQNRIYRQRADGSGEAELLTEAAETLSHQYPVWAPDGRLTYEELDARGNRRVLIASIPDGEAEVLVTAESAPFGISFSADGRAMAYSSSSEGFQVFAEPFPPDRSRVRLSTAPGPGAAWPIWSREGSRVRFQTANNSYEAVDLDPGSFALRNRRVLPVFGVPNNRLHDSIPGTNQMLIVTPPDVADEVEHRLVVVENWIEEVKRRVPAD